jgi:hypothetical protein
MFHEVLVPFFLGSSVSLSLLLWFVYSRQYRFATFLFDMLPFYPIIVIVASIAGIGSDIYLALKFSELFYWLLPILTIDFGIQFILFWQWFSQYRLSNYTKFLQHLSNSPNVRVISIGEWLAKPEKDPNHILVLIRHDVDVRLSRARRMAKEEMKLGIPSCYYFRNSAERYTFDDAKELIKEIASAGLLEVGFHYETVSNVDGDVIKATDLFQKEVEEFRRIYPIRMISAHGDGIVRDISEKLVGRNFSLVSERLVDLNSLGLVSAYHLFHDYYLSDAMGLHHFDRCYYFDPSYMHPRFLDNLKLLDQLPKGTLVQILIHPDWWF